MFQIPSTPPIEGFHPFIVHFAVGILLSAWVPMLLGIVDKARRVSWLRAGLMMIIMGTLFMLGAVFTGEAAESVVLRDSQVVENAIHEHEELGELARNLFLLVSVLYGGSWIVHWKIKESRKKLVALVGACLVGISYTLGALALANAGHQGGLLVHDLGLHAPVSPNDHRPIDDK